MKFTVTCLITLLALSSVQADANTNAANCMVNLPKPYTSGTGASDDTCPKAYLVYGVCIAQNCAQKTQNLGDYAGCLKSSCKSDNANVQKYIDGQIKCIYSRLLSFAVMMVAIFAFMY
ncbi:hypothetical protein ABPG72_015286 [Tetrahymena utriculariae]